MIPCPLSWCLLVRANVPHLRENQTVLYSPRQAPLFRLNRTHEPVTKTLSQAELQRAEQTIGIRFAAGASGVPIGLNLFPHSELVDSFANDNYDSTVLPWLSVGLPNSFDESTNELIWFPHGLPSGFESKRTIFIASSRLSQIATHDDWFDALRTLACRLDGERVCLLTGKKTTADRFVKRVGTLFGIPVASLCLGPKSVDKKWMLNSLNSPESEPGCYSGFVLQVGSDTTPKTVDPVLVQVAGEVRALNVRAKGNVDKAISSRCNQLENPNVFLLDAKSETKPEVLRRLLKAGCHRWILYEHEDPELTQPPELEFRIPRTHELPSGEFLIHCTRASADAWPGQQESEYLDELIFQHERRDHSLDAALTRILATGRILANNRITRDKRNVVCFTSATLEELKKLTTFRSHLKRWDFQPVGIAIRKSALERRGARPVIYGDEATWENLAPENRPFFQIAQSTTRTGNVLDWTREKEWRVLGDVELNEFKVGEIFAISTV